MDFHDKKIDEALRLFQGDIRIQGEAQKVERLVEVPYKLYEFVKICYCHRLYHKLS